MLRPKAAPSRLDPLSYESLRQQILRRDGWRCQSCGTMSNLEVHHRKFRSHSGSDSEENLITLCAPCHVSVHRHSGEKPITEAKLGKHRNKNSLWQPDL
jgi:5-methylcytosine-specific restriction endonuclease McrA